MTFSAQELAELCAILWPRDARLIEKLSLDSLTDDDKEDIRGALSEELVAVGLDDDSEPNEVGLKIERLIDRV